MAKLDEVLQLTTQAGVPEEDVKRAWERIGNSPETAKMDSAQVAKSLIAVLPKVTVTGKRTTMDAPDMAPTGVPRLPNPVTDLPSAYRGTAMASRNPLNPQAELMNQFDPAAMNAAKAQYERNLAAMRGDRAATGGLAGMMSGLARSPAFSQQNDAFWADRDKLNEALTTGHQKNLAELAAKGILSAGQQQAQDVVAAGFPLEQGKRMQELAQMRNQNILGGFSAEQMQRLNDPDSAETMAAKSLISSQIAAIPTAQRRELAAVIGNPKVTAAQLMPIMAQYAPAAQKAYLDMLGGQNVQAQTGLIGEQTRQTSLGNKIVDTTTAGGTRVPVGGVPSISAGPVSIGFPQIQQREQGKGEAAVDAERRLRNYTTFVEPAINSTLKKLEGTDAGKLTDFKARMLPGEERELVNMLAEVNNLYPGVMPAELASAVKAAQAGGEFTGSAVSKMSTQHLKNFLWSIKNRAEADKNYQREIDAEQGMPSSPAVKQPPAKSNVTPVIKTQEEYDKLPKGTVYIDGQDGKKYRKS